MKTMKRSTKALVASGLALVFAASVSAPAFANGTENKACGAGNGVTVYGTSSQSEGATYIEEGSCGTLSVRSYVTYDGSGGYAGWVSDATDAIYNAPGEGYVISKSDHSTSYNSVWTK